MAPWALAAFVAFAVYIVFVVIPRVDRQERGRWQKRREELWRVWFSKKKDP